MTAASPRSFRRRSNRLPSAAALGICLAVLTGGCPVNPDAGPQRISAERMADPPPPPYISPVYSPIGFGSPQTFVIDPVVEAQSEVKLTFWARGHFSGTGKYVNVFLDGVPVGEVFRYNAADCSDPPEEAVLTVPMDAFNVAAQDARVEIRMETTNGVLPGFCTPPSTIQVRVDYCGGPDCNGNGVADNCDIQNGDAVDEDGNGVPDECEFVVDSIVPNQGPLVGGTVVTIRGDRFTPETSVRFGDRASAEVTVLNARMLVAVTPSNPDAVLGGDGFVDVVLERVEPRPMVTVAADGFRYYVLPPDDGTDTDGDGLTDHQELLGWEVYVETFGLGLGGDMFGNFSELTRYTGFSDPQDPDTDGDGLDDFTEFQIKSDATRRDTDSDGLWDSEEWNRWLTSPTSVDTDGDSRGPLGNLPPNQALFDGQELYTIEQLGMAPDQRGEVRPRATSPTLSDTDGDGASDYDEFELPGRSPVLADLPRIELLIEDQVDIRLNTEFAEERGVVKEASFSFSNGSSSSVASSKMTHVEAGLSIGVEVGYGGTPPGVTAKGTNTVSISGGAEWSNSTETATTTQQEWASSQAESATKTEIAASGSLSMGIRVRNAGNVSFQAKNLGYTARFWKPKYDPDDLQAGEFRALATLSPSSAFLDGFTLAPGESTGVVQVEAPAVTASAVKEFLARPRSLQIAPAYVDLIDAEGRNFAFIKQFTLAQTAELSIDYGNEVVERYHVATNVDRDEAGGYVGIPLVRVLEALDIPYEVAHQDGTGEIVLTRVRDVSTEGNSFWAVFVGSDPPLDAPPEFLSYRMRAGHAVLLTYTRDGDGDELTFYEEMVYGTSDNAEDTDGDGLPDTRETRVWRDPDDSTVLLPGGWEVQVDGEDRYRVFSDPASADADGDGLSDHDEYLGLDGEPPVLDNGDANPSDTGDATDPNKQDTDGDGLDDRNDPHPLIPASPLFVKADAPGGGDGDSWNEAFNDLADAIAAAIARNTDTDDDGDPFAANDVSQIWVAAGLYTAPPGGFVQPGPAMKNLLIFGGFNGTESTVSQRNPDGLTNGCNLTAVAGATPLYFRSGSDNVAVDGFLISDVTGARAVYIGGGSITCRNCVFVDNARGAVQVSGGLVHKFESCSFSGNTTTSTGGGGAAFVTGSNATSVTFTGCDFVGNGATGDIPTGNPPNGGGAVAARDTGSVNFLDCRFHDNYMWVPSDPEPRVGQGGAVFLSGCTGRFTNCVFDGNTIQAESFPGPFTYGRAGGAVSVFGTITDPNGGGDGLFLNCLFANNTGDFFGGGLYVGPYSTSHVINCTFAENRVTARGVTVTCDAPGFPAFDDQPYSAGGGLGSLGTTLIVNSNFWGNTVTGMPRGNLLPPGGYPVNNDIQSQVSRGVAGFNECALQVFGTLWLSFSDVQYLYTRGIGTSPFFGSGMISDDPLLTSSYGLQAGSPCIDAGNKTVDADPITAGFQLLPTVDLRGNPRIVDGDGDGHAAVDMGAFEYQGGE